MGCELPGDTEQHNYKLVYKLHWTSRILERCWGLRFASRSRSTTFRAPNNFGFAKNKTSSLTSRPANFTRGFHAMYPSYDSPTFLSAVWGSVRISVRVSVETITEGVGPERESNLRPPARDSFKHGSANVHMVHAA